MVAPQIIVAFPSEMPPGAEFTMQVAAIGDRPFDSMTPTDVTFNGAQPVPQVRWISIRSPNSMLVRVWVPATASGPYNLITRRLTLRDALTVGFP